jgi:hypothetical protein
MNMLGHLAIQTVFGNTTEILDLPENSANMIEAIRERCTKQVRLIFLGASDWDIKSEKQQKLEAKANRKKKKSKTE